MVIKVLAAEADLTSASNVTNATLVRVYNGHSAVSVITRKDSGGSTIGSMTVLNGTVVFMEKNATDMSIKHSNCFRFPCVLTLPKSIYLETV